MGFGGGGSSSISSASDVALNNPGGNQVFTYDTATSKWKNAPAPVTSVAGRTGAVSLGVADISAGGSPGPNTYLRGDGVWTTLDNNSQPAEAPTITTANLETITQGVVFNQTLSASGTVPIVWAVVSGSLPSGLILNQATGVIDGTPTSATAYAFTVRATNSVGYDEQGYGDTVAATPVAPTISTIALNGLTQGVTFSQTLQAVGTTPISFAVTSGTLPAGLSLSSLGTISGTPTGSGAYSFTVTATNTAGSDPQVLTGSVANTSSSYITSDSFNRADAADITGSNTDAAEGGTALKWQSNATAVWSIVSNRLTANTNVSGGSYLPVSVADYEISAVIATMTNLTGINVWAIDGRRNQLSTTGSTQYRLRLISNGTIALTKVVSGTETTLWTSSAGLASTGARLALRMVGTTISVWLNGTLQQSVTDSSISTSAYAGFARLNQGTGAWEDVRILVPSGSSAVAPIITTTSLNTLTANSAFTQTLQAEGTAPITWAVSSGTLPTGITLNPSTGVLAGTPTVAGDYDFTVSATNSAGADTQDLDGTIATASATAPVITTTSLNSLTVGSSFSQTIAASGSNPKTWAVTAGSLPAGLSLSSSTGTISGTPTTAAAYSFTLTATNGAGSDPQAFTGTVLAASTGGAPARTASYGPNGTHYPERAKWVGSSTGWASSVEVAASWSAISTAITNATNNFPNGDCRILVQPGTLTGNGAGSTSTPVLQNIGSRTRARRIVIAPRDGIWSVSFSNSLSFHDVNGVAFIGFQLIDKGEAIPQSGASINIRNTADFAWAWSKLSNCNITSNTTVSGVTVTSGVELCEVVKPGALTIDGDSWAIRNTSGSTYSVDGVKYRGCYVGPAHKTTGSSAHCDSLQFSAGVRHDHIEFEDTVVWASTNAAVIGSGDGIEANGGSRYGKMDHSMFIGSARTLYRYPQLAGEATINSPVGFNSECPLWEATNESYIFGKNVPFWTRVTNSYGTQTPSNDASISGGWSIDASLAPNAAWFDARVPKPTDAYLESIWSW